MPIIDPVMWGPQTHLARSADGQTMVLVRSSEIFALAGSSSGSDPAGHRPGQGSGRRTAAIPCRLQPRHARSPAAAAGSRTEGRGRPGNPNRNGPFRGYPFTVQLAPKGNRVYMLGDFSRLIIWES